MACNNNEDSLKKKTAEKLNKVFKRMACKDPRKAIHVTALSSALIVAALPIGVDAWALRLSECLMLMSIYAHYDIKLSQSAAESLLTAAFAQAVGESIAYAALEAADAAAVLTGGTSLAICIPIAAGLIEAVGWTTIKYIEGNGVAKVAIRTMELVGGIADVNRLADTVSAPIPTETPDSSAISNTGDSLSFTGSAYTMKDLEEAGKRIEREGRKGKQYATFVEKDIRSGRDPSKNMIKLKYVNRALDKAIRESERIKSRL